MFTYGFEDGEDYVVTDIFVHNSLGGKQFQLNHILTLDTAKEIAMIQRNNIGKLVRKHFISAEKELQGLDSRSQ